MSQIKIQCPAKINLTLKVTGKRADGYHNIESIMQTINLYDYLTISLKPSDEFNIKLAGTSNQIPYNEKNLVWKAALLFINNLSDKKHFSIDVFIEKNIPIAAGLAGGSTNGAGIIYGLNKLLNEPYTRTELHKLCAELGSDLNFCLEGGRQMASGRGEILTELPYEQRALSLIKPLNLGISAGEAYSKFSQKNAIDNKDRDKFINDLEWAVLNDYPELQKIKSLYPDAVMSGSGSTYYRFDKKFEPVENYWIANEIETTNRGIIEI